MQAEHPDAVVETWCHEQARRGRTPVIRRVWAPRGRRPVAASRPRYEWLSVTAFAHPPSGRSEWWLLPSVSVEVMTLALAAFARDVGAGPGKQVVLVLDQAGWHTSPGLVVPAGLHLVFLPPYTPEVQPAERLWPLLNEGIANREHADLAALEAGLAGRCRQLLAQPETVRGATHYHWWPAQ